MITSHYTQYLVPLVYLLPAAIAFWIVDMKVDEIVRWADSLMYMAKRHGGNRICAMTEAEEALSSAPEGGADPASERRSA